MLLKFKNTKTQMALGEGFAGSAVVALVKIRLLEGEGYNSGAFRLPAGCPDHRPTLKTKNPPRRVEVFLLKTRGLPRSSMIGTDP